MATATDPRTRSAQHSGRRGNSAVLEMLETLARKRSANPAAKTIQEYALALSRYSEDSVRIACEMLSGEEIAPFATRWPELSRLEGLCRQYERPADNSWTVERYRECRDFDLWLTGQMQERNCSREALITTYLNVPNAAERAVHEGMVYAWTAWRNQLDAGTINCPGWCETCSGDRYIVSEFRGRRAAAPCPSCRRPGSPTEHGAAASPGRS